MRASEGITEFAEETAEKISLHDQQDGDDGLMNDVATVGQIAICTAESCPIPMNGSHDGPSSLDDSKTSESKSQSEGASNPTIASSEKLNKKNTRKSKNKNKKEGGTQQSVSSIQQIHTQSDLNKVLQEHDTILLEFVTTWCTACHGIQPRYEELAKGEMGSNENSDAMLRATQVVCDKNKETKKLADANGVGSYPVFVLYQQGTEVSKWKGADV
ncbi:unnamed protein product, partial [Cylindrotheca closterium]